MHSFLADVVVVIHLAVVLFMVGGLLLILVGWPLRWRWIRNPRFRLVHLGIMVYIAVNAMLGKLCFLTIWERDLRRSAGETIDDASFVGRLMHDILFVDVPQRELNKAYLIVGLVVLVSVVFVRPRFRRER